MTSLYNGQNLWRKGMNLAKVIDDSKPKPRIDSSNNFLSRFKILNLSVIITWSFSSESRTSKPSMTLPKIVYFRSKVGWAA